MPCVVCPTPRQPNACSQTHAGVRTQPDASVLLWLRGSAHQPQQRVLGPCAALFGACVAQAPHEHGRRACHCASRCGPTRVQALPSLKPVSLLHFTASVTRPFNCDLASVLRDSQHGYGQRASQEEGQVGHAGPCGIQRACGRAEASAAGCGGHCRSDAGRHGGRAHHDARHCSGTGHGRPACKQRGCCGGEQTTPISACLAREAC